MTYLFAAYTAIWLLLFGYVMLLSSKQKRLNEELGSLKRQLDERR